MKNILRKVIIFVLIIIFSCPIGAFVSLVEADNDGQEAVTVNNSNDSTTNSQNEEVVNNDINQESNAIATEESNGQANSATTTQENVENNTQNVESAEDVVVLDDTVETTSVKYQSDLFQYTTGEIIVKYKQNKQEKTIDELLNNTNNKARIKSNNITKQRLEENFVKSNQADSKIINKIGLDRVSVYKIPDLKQKVDNFIKKTEQKIQPQDLDKLRVIKKGVQPISRQEHQDKLKNISNKKIQVNTEEFGEVEVNLEDEKNLVDPYSQELLQALNQDPDVEYAELNKIVYALASTSTDPYYSRMWSLENTGQAYPTSATEMSNGTADADIDAEAGWDKDASNGGKNIVVAVIDTGIDYTHEDLGSCTLVEVNDQDPLTCPKFVPGYDFVNSDNNPMDGNGHGTHCAGTIAALNNDKGIVGVAYNAKLMGVKGLSDQGYGSTWDLVQAVQWAVDNGADVLSNSWGGWGDSQTLRDVFQYAYDRGVTSIAAAGNSYQTDALLFMPAMFDTVITVGASDANDELAYFSNIGPKIDVVAPGVSILSLKSSTSQIANDRPYAVYENDYLILSGTSMATPHVAGVAALIKANYFYYTPEQIRQAIRVGADDLGSVGFDETFGYGRLNLDGSLSLAGAIPSLLISSPVHNEVISGNTNITGSITGAETSIESWGLYYRTVASSTLNAINGTGCSGSVASSSINCYFNVSALDDKDYYLTLKATNTASQVFYDIKKIIINNIEITNIQNSDIYRLGDSLTINGKVNNANFSFKWSPNAQNNWSQTGLSTTTPSALNENVELGTWNTASSSSLSKGYYDLKLSIGARSEQVNKIYFDPDLRSGWPVRIEWDDTGWDWSNLIKTEYENKQINVTLLNTENNQVNNVALQNKEEIDLFLKNQNNINSVWWGGHHSPVVADVTGDDIKEIITSKIGVPSKIFIHSADGNLFKEIPLEPSTDVSNVSTPLVDDIDGDGINEIIVYTPDSSSNFLARLYAFNSDGTSVSGYPIILPFNNGATLSSADLDNDGIKEIIVLEKSTFYTRKLTIIKNASILSQFDVEPHNWWNLNDIYSNIAVGNLDEDSDLEMVVAGPSINSGYDYETEQWTLEGKIEVYNIDGTAVNGWPKTVADNIWSSPVIGDVNDDGDNEIVIGTDVGMYAFDKNGNTLSGWPLLETQSIWSTASLADVNNNNFLETAFSSLNYQTYLTDYQGNILSNWPQSTGMVLGSTNMADIDNDGTEDVIALAHDNIYAWNSTGTPLANFPKVIGYGSWGNVGLAVDDLNNDNTLELIAASNGDSYYDDNDGYWKSKLRGSVYVWDLNTGYATSSLPWPTFQRNAQRTGYYVDESIEIPLSLTANGKNPSDWQWGNGFTIDWTNSTTTYPVFWYKLGSIPTSDTDGTSTTTKPFNITATETGGQMLYVWLENSAGNKNYTRYGTVNLRYDTDPIPPINLTANGSNPSPTSGNPNFEINWTNPDTQYDIVKYWYKLGTPPASNGDGTSAATKPFSVTATQENGQTLYVWLEDNQGNRDYNNYAYVNLNYVQQPVSAPTKLYGMPGDEQVTLYWNASAEIGYPITGYNIYQSLSYDFATSSLISSSTIVSTTYTVAGLGNWTTYYFGVKAVDNQGNESPLSEKTFVTPYPGPYYQFGDELRISPSISSQYSPQIYDNKIVWEDYRNHGYYSDIYMYNLETGQETQITSNLSSQYTPDIYGDKIVWRDHRNAINGLWGNADIYMYNLETGQETQITSNISGQYSPDIYDNKIIWRDYRDGNQSIYLYDLDTQNKQKISYNLSNPHSPKIYENKIIWTDRPAYSQVADIYYYDLDANTSTKILSNLSGYFIPDIYENKIVWDSSNTGNQEIYLYDLDTATSTQITWNASAQHQPVIYNNKIVWEDYRNGTGDIYLYDIATKNEYQITWNLSAQYQPAIYNEKIAWLDVRDSTDFNWYSNIYTSAAYTIPNAPTNLTADGSNPSPTKNTTDFIINWTNPFSPPGIKGARYKLGSTPTSNEDGVYTTDKPFTVNATAENQTLYLWLENNDGYKDYTHNASVVLNYDIPSSGGGGGGGGGGGYRKPGPTTELTDNATSTTAQDVSTSTTSTDLDLIDDADSDNQSAQDKNLSARELQVRQILTESKMVFDSGLNNANLDGLIKHNSKIKDMEAQKQGMEKYIEPLLSDVQGLIMENIYSINNFIVYGTQSTKILGAGERAGVVNSYKAAFGKLPVGQDEWEDVLKIANGRWPSVKNIEAEIRALGSFTKIYKRLPNYANSHDEAAIKVMAYGLRPTDRNLDSEKAAIKSFKHIYKNNPTSTVDWDIVRAIAYSGATR